MNILLVEDDEVDVLNITRAFAKTGNKGVLFVATNGLEALEILRSGSRHGRTFPKEKRLILLDLNMPKMGGIEFLVELRADPQLKLLPVVVLTTSAEDRDRVQAYDLNVAGYLVKPVEYSFFMEAVATINSYWSQSEFP
ncbi:MAG TPA: response regulator [Stenomitos sp.]